MELLLTLLEPGIEGMLSWPGVDPNGVASADDDPMLLFSPFIRRFPESRAAPATVGGEFSAALTEPELYHLLNVPWESLTTVTLIVPFLALSLPSSSIMSRKTPPTWPTT